MEDIRRRGEKAEEKRASRRCDGDQDHEQEEQLQDPEDADCPDAEHTAGINTEAIKQIPQPAHMNPPHTSSAYKQT